MSNQLYTKAKEKFLSGAINLTSDSIKVCLVSSSYTPSITTHEFLSDLGANRLGTDQTLTSKSVTNGVFDCADPTWPTIASGTVTYMVTYKDSGTASTSPLIHLVDTASSGLPVTGNGSSVTVTVDSGSNKLFAL